MNIFIMIKLLPCPICDTTAVATKKVRGGFIAFCELSTPRGWMHKNERCNVQNVCTTVFKTAEEAAEQWNWRLE